MKTIFLWVGVDLRELPDKFSFTLLLPAILAFLVWGILT